MKKLPAIPLTLAINNAPGTFLDVFIPKNTWAEFKRLIVMADFALARNAPIPAGNTQYFEGYDLQGLGFAPRLPVQNIAATSLQTRYFINREFIYEIGGDVYEQNVQFFGTGGLNAAQGIDHRAIVNNLVGIFDPTVDAHLLFQLYNTDPTTADVCIVHTAYAFIESPLDLRRLPR